MIRKAISATFFAISLLLLASCTFTNIKTKELSVEEIQGIKSEISAIVRVDSLSFMDKEVTKINDVFTELQVKLINPENIPEDEDGKKELAKSIALRVKNSLAQSGRYSQYEISFVSMKGNKLVSSSLSHSHTFMDNEL